MVVSDGSRWYFPVYEGLWKCKHVAQMGQAIWLYGWILARAHVAQNGGIISYQHVQAAEELGKTERTIRTWFNSLQEHGYIITRARHPYELEVQVLKWRPIEEWLNARQDRKNLSMRPEKNFQNGRETGRETGKTFPSGHITIKLLCYKEDPTGSQSERPTPISLADSFQKLLERLRTAKNRPAVLKEIYHFCFGGWGDTEPSYGYLAKVAKSIGGAGRLAQVMWELSANRPSGDVLAYIQAMHKQNKRRRDKGSRTQDAIAKADAAILEYAGRADRE